MIIDLPKLGPVRFRDDLTPEQFDAQVKQLAEKYDFKLPRPDIGLGEIAKRGFMRSMGETGIALGDVVPAMAGSALGYEDYARQQMEEAAKSREELEAKYPTRFKSYKEISSPREALEYGAETVGELAPTALTALVPGVGLEALGGRMAGRTALEAATMAGPPSRAALLGAKEAAEAGARKGMYAGVYLGSLAQNVPDVFQSIYDETGGKLEPGIAALAGGISAVLDSALPTKVIEGLGKYGKLKAIESVAKNTGAAPSVWKAIGREALEAAATEGLTETAQEAISAYAEHVAGSTKELFGKEHMERFQESFVKGAIGGGVFGIPGGLAKGLAAKAEYAEQQPKEGETTEKPPPERNIPEDLGMSTRSKAAKNIMDLDLTTPEGVEQLVATVENPNFKGKIDETKYNALLETLDPQYVEAARAKLKGVENVGQPVSEPSGTSPSVVSQPDTGAAPTTTGRVEPSGVVSTEPDVGGIGAGTGTQPSTLKSTPKTETQQRIDQLTQEFIDAGFTPDNARRMAETDINEQIQSEEEYRQQEKRDAEVREIAKANFDSALAESGDTNAAFDSYRQNVADTLDEQGKTDLIEDAHREFDRLVEEHKAKQEAPIEEQRKQLRDNYDAAEAKLAELNEQLNNWKNLKPSEIDAIQTKIDAAEEELEAAKTALSEGNRALDDLEDKQAADKSNLQPVEDEEKILARIQDEGNAPINIEDYADGLMPNYDYYAATTKQGKFTKYSISNIRHVTNLADAQAAVDAGMEVFEVERKSVEDIEKQIRALAAEVRSLLTKNGSPPRTGTKNRLRYDTLQKQIKTLDAQLPSGYSFFAREEPLPYLAGMHPETATAVQENDINGALKSLVRNTSGFFTDIAKRLLELNLQTGISFDNERNLVRRAIDFTTAAQQKRLFTYISVSYSNYYDKYFKNYDREENLEKVFEGLKRIGNLDLGPVIDEYNDVVYRYEKTMPGLTAPGAYFPEFNEITLNTKTRTGTGNRVFMHEAVHAATVAVLAKDFSKLTPVQQEGVQSLWEMYRYAESIVPPGYYGMTNIFEFVSELFTNKKFQDRLRTIPYKTKVKKTNLLTAFVQKILSLFGMDNLASSAMVEAEKIFSAELALPTVSAGPKFANGKRIRGPISTPDIWRSGEWVARTYMDVVNDAIKGRMSWNEARKEISSTLWSGKGGSVKKFVLGFLNLRQLADLTATKFPQLTGAIKVIEEMLSYRGTKLKRAESITSKWIAAQRKNPEMSSSMSRIMLEATIRGIDPDTAAAGTLNKPFQDAWNALDSEFKQIYREVRDFYADSVKDMVDTLKERAKAHGTPTEIAKRLKDINDQFGPDKLVKPYFPLRRFGDHWFQIGSGNFKEFYTFESRSTRDLTMRKRIEELKAGNKQQQALAETVNAGSGTSDLFASMSTTKVIQDAQKLIDNIGSGLNLATETGASAAAKLKEEMKDTLNQLLYITLPQTSIRKMFINRKSIQGASEDMLRVFATTAVHSAYQQSRFKYAESFLSNLVNARDYIKNFSPERQAIYDDYIKEVEARTKTILSTEDTSTTAKVAGKLSESTFYFMLSAPFTAALNIIGASTIAMPYIGARYGYAKANALMLENLGKYTATAPTRTFAPMAKGKFLETRFPSIVESGKLSSILQRAADLFVADGDITISLTNDINNLAERPSGLYTGRYENVKKVLSGLFHQSERLNREVVLMTTFELAHEKFKNANKTDLQGVIERDKTTGQPIKYTDEEAFQAAIAEAREVAGQTLGDFSRQMKPRYFTSPALSVLTKFKQYSVLATYVVMRNLYLSVGAPFSKSELAEYRAQLEKDLKNDPDKDTIINQRMSEIEGQRQELYKEARRRLAGILGMTFLYGGIEAMPFFSLLGPIVGMFAGGGGDDGDDPDLFEWHSWFRNYMQETFGGAAGAILARGLGTAVTGGALSERVSLDLKDLWYRDGRYSPDVRQSTLETAIANSGPVVGLGMNWVDAYGLAKEGQLERAFEKLLPSIASKPLAAARIAVEGGQTRRGIELAQDFSAWEIALQAVGLQPERLAIAQKNAIDAKLHEQKVSAERTALLNRLWMERGTDQEDEIMEKIDNFNERHPIKAITGETIRDSFKQREKSKTIAEEMGVQLTDPKMLEEVEPKLRYKPYSLLGGG